MIRVARRDKLSAGLSKASGLEIRQGTQTSVRSSAGTVGLYRRDIFRPEESKLIAYVAGICEYRKKIFCVLWCG